MLKQIKQMMTNEMENKTAIKHLVQSVLNVFMTTNTLDMAVKFPLMKSKHFSEVLGTHNAHAVVDMPKK